MTTFPSSAMWAIVRELPGKGLGPKVLLRRSGQVRDAAFWRARSRSEKVETIGSHLSPLRCLAIRPLAVAGAVATIAIGAAPTAGAGPDEQLRNVLPAGYGPASCQSPDNPSSPTGVPQSTHALAALECRDNSLPGGPTYAYYRLYGDQTTLDKAFSGEKGASRQAYWWFLPCPGQEGTGPATWRDNRAPDKVAGWVVCGKVYGPVHGNPEAKSIMWTRDSDLLLSIAEGPDLASLYDWWTRNR